MDVTVTTNSIITGTTIDTPRRIQSAKIIPFTNGVAKHENALVGGGIRYTECLKNHAASLGSHALDGCGEFMPAPTAVVSDPTSLKCAACGCHRNFHRQERQSVQRVIEYHSQNRHHPLPPRGLVAVPPPPDALAACQVRSPVSDDESPPPISSTYYPVSTPHTLLAMSSGGGAAITTNNNNNNNISLQIPSRKRFRTKFSQDQKEKMQELAEKIEWKMAKSNEELINEFCKEIGVQRGVFKVWMHNNKSTIAKTPKCESTNHIISANQAGINIKLINNNINNINNNNNNNNNNNPMENLDGNSNNSSSINNSHTISLNNASSSSS